MLNAVSDPIHYTYNITCTILPQLSILIDSFEINIADIITPHSQKFYNKFINGHAVGSRINIISSVRFFYEYVGVNIELANFTFSFLCHRLIHHTTNTLSKWQNISNFTISIFAVST